MTDIMMTIAGTVGIVAVAGANSSPRGSRAERQWCLVGWSTLLLIAVAGICGVAEVIQGVPM